jgi:flagellar motor switch protein FliM
MNRILSQNEVDALLKTVSGPPPEPEKPADDHEEPVQQAAQTETSQAPPQPKRRTGNVKRATSYNFRRPDRVPKSMLRSLQLIHDKFCSNVSSSLSAYLRAVTEVSLLSVEQTSYNEFLLSLSDPTCYNAVTIKPLTGMAALEMNLDMAFPLIDRLLGGTGNVPKLSRNITDIERILIQGVIKVLLSNLKESWAPVVPVDFVLHASESRPQLLQIASANEVVILVIFEIKIGDVRKSAHLCIPFAALEPVAANFTQDMSIRRNGDQAADLRHIVNSLYRAVIPVTAELTGTLVSVKDLLSLANGDVVRLDRKVSDRLSVRVGGSPKFESEPLMAGGQKAVRIVGPILQQ